MDLAKYRIPALEPGDQEPNARTEAIFTFVPKENVLLVFLYRRACISYFFAMTSDSVPIMTRRTETSSRSEPRD